MILRLHIIIILAVAVSACGISDSQWEKARVQLSEIKKNDQRYRPLMDSAGRAEGWGSKTVEALWEKQKALDSANLVAIDRLISQYGYPSKLKVGDMAEVPFLVIQHADDSAMATFYEVVIGAGKNGDLRMRDVAQFQDHVLMVNKQPQEYGTQIWIDFKEYKATGERYDSVFLWPVRDRTQLNEKRLSVGLDSLESHLRRYGIDPAKGYLLRRSTTVL